MRKAPPPRSSPDDDVRALYSIPELAAYAKTSRFRMARLIATAEITVVRSGRTILVPISELQRKLPQLLDAIVLVGRLRDEEKKAPTRK